MTAGFCDCRNGDFKFANDGGDPANALTTEPIQKTGPFLMRLIVGPVGRVVKTAGNSVAHEKARHEGGLGGFKTNVLTFQAGTRCFSAIGWQNGAML